MFLKKLVVHGFKSFADRTVFEFDRGITGIVGPNGCGKSNVLDAVRWVLGEQSAKTLRGSRMLDVVFSGSRSRKPAHCAEVELTFDNGSGFLQIDQSEVSVGRVLYASGDSEYRINGQACRLRDVRELFLDTGVGVDAYSVIEQGRVDMMLHASPTERRELFEEAAGISRYQVRRAEAQRKLERTQNNLLRLNDVVDELEKRLRSVKVAAGKARNFQEYDARLRELRSGHALAEYHRLQREQRAHERAAGRIEDLLAARRAQLARCDEKAAELERQRRELDERISAAEAEARQVENEAGATAERIRQCELRLDELQQTRTRLVAEAQHSAAELEQVQARLADEQQQLAQLTLAETEESAAIERLRGERDAAAGQRAAARAELDQARSAAYEAARQVTLLHNEQVNLEQQIERLSSQLRALEGRAAEAAGQLERLLTDRARLDQRVRELDDAAGARGERLAGHDARLAELTAELEALAREQMESKEARSGLLSRLSLLEDLERRQEGVDEGVRAMLAWRDEPGNPAGVIGLIADVLRIDDPRVVALEPVLSRFEQWVVVEEAHRALPRLARGERAGGRVGLLALDRLRPAEHGLRFHGAPGVVARAIDWVRCEPRYRSLAEQLLSCVIVVDSAERAMALANEAPEGYAFVTLDGVCIEPGGRISVGGVAAVGGLISRKAEIRAVRGQLDEIETRLERATRQRGELEERISDERMQREALLSEIATVQRQHAETQAALARCSDEAQRLERERRQLAQQQGEIEQALAQARERIAELISRHDEGRAAQAQHEQRISALEESAARLEQVTADFAQQLTAAQVAFGRTSERRAARAAALQGLAEQAQSLEARRAGALREAESAAARDGEVRGELEQCRARRTALEGQSRQRAALLEELERQRGGLRRQVDSCGAVLRRVHEEIEAADAALGARQVQLRETVVRQENLVTRVGEELGLDLRALYVGYEHAEQDWEAIRAEIETLRGKIARLGNVNMDALAELEELTPRVEKLTAQREDLLTSIGQLERLIADLDEESTARFNACFAEVRENFQALFRKLFGGGKADIILEDPERPLECGIEIIARPPGKEPQTLSLLSGGEKTMTAVALLFAVFQRKPSPFAILDEVDAALDESNIDRFNNIVIEFLNESQFIVITHSKRTMQCADVLYGVTMEEPGVSKRVSVRFDDRVETPSVA